MRIFVQVKEFFSLSKNSHIILCAFYFVKCPQTTFSLVEVYDRTAKKYFLSILNRLRSKLVTLMYTFKKANIKLSFCTIRLYSFPYKSMYHHRISYRREMVPQRGLGQHKVPVNIDRLNMEPLHNLNMNGRNREVKVPMICIHCLLKADYSL